MKVENIHNIIKYLHIINTLLCINVLYSMIIIHKKSYTYKFENIYFYIPMYTHCNTTYNIIIGITFKSQGNGINNLVLIKYRIISFIYNVKNILLIFMCFKL